jgi:hypothetical protein
MARVLTLIFGDLLAQGFGGAFHLLGLDSHTSQFL